MKTPHIQDLISRRAILSGVAGLPLLTLATGCVNAPETAAPESVTPATPTGPGFASVAPNRLDAVVVPEGYEARTLIAWGDALFDTVSPTFDLNALTRAEQEQRFGQNNDMLALFPATWTFPKAKDQKRFVLCANNEYVDPTFLFPAVTDPKGFTPAQIEAAFAAMGISVVTIEEEAGQWRVVRDAKPGAGLNRRITPFSPMVIAGPAAKHPWIVAGAAKFNAGEKGAPAGAVACGTHSNCAGGETPWGTYLSAEENFNGYFFNSKPAAKPDPILALDAKVMGYPLAKPDPRPGSPRQFDLAENPTGPALYGWTVEVDPYDPTWTPRKRTALGRRKGECATTALTRDGRVAVYSGDDQADEFVYKFITAGRFNPADRLANRDLLDEGQLYVAQFEGDGAGRWIALTLEAANAAATPANQPPFKDAGDLAIRAREAARLLGATPMDRPEDVEAVLDVNWVGQGPVLVVCTNNRTNGTARPGNPRRPGPEPQPNRAGHVLRLDETGGDVGALTFTWNVFALAGDPNLAPDAVAESGAHVGVSLGGTPTFAGDFFACPDNVCFDSAGQVWISTDAADDVFAACNDSVLVTPVNAAGPRPVKRFLTAPVGAEVCGPMLSPDERTFFAAIQHPGESDATGKNFRDVRWSGGTPASSFPDGGTAWPRSAVVTVRRKDGGVVGA